MDTVISSKENWTMFDATKPNSNWKATFCKLLEWIYIIYCLSGPLDLALSPEGVHHLKIMSNVLAWNKTGLLGMYRPVGPYLIQLRSIQTMRVRLHFLDILTQTQGMGYIPILRIKATSS